MEQTIEGSITKSYQEFNKEKIISFSFPLKGYEKGKSILSFLKKIYQKSFIHDFYSVLSSKVE